MVACWLEDPDSMAFKKYSQGGRSCGECVSLSRHLPRVGDYLWVAEDGMKMQGYNGSQLWDTAFAIQAIISVDDHHLFTDTLKKGHQYLHSTQVTGPSNVHKTGPVCQIRKEVEGSLDEFYRHNSLGAWPFSTADHGWPISDCTSEALKAALLLRQLPEDIVGAPIPVSWLFQAVNVILSYQNSDGGVATYENSRSFAFIEVRS